MVKVTVTSPDHRHALDVELVNVSDDQYRLVLKFLEDRLTAGDKAFEAIAATFIKAVRLCPDAIRVTCGATLSIDPT